MNFAEYETRRLMQQSLMMQFFWGGYRWFRLQACRCSVYIILWLENLYYWDVYFDRDMIWWSLLFSLLFVNVFWLSEFLSWWFWDFAFWSREDINSRGVTQRQRERERSLYHYASEGCFYCRGSRRLVSQCFCRWAFLPLVRQRSRWSRAAVCLAVMQRVLVLSFNLAGIVVAPCSTPCGPTDDVKLQRDAPSPLPRPPPPI